MYQEDQFMLIVLSPSKTQDISHRPEDLEYTVPEYHEDTTTLVSSLRKYSTEEISKLMKVSANLAATTQQRFAVFSSAPITNYAAQALLAFRGDVFSEIHADGYSTEDFSFAQKHLRILSGLYGILRPLDLMQPYRLEMGGSFVPGGAKDLYEFWRTKITAALQRVIATEGHDELLNLASNEYFKAIDTTALQIPITDVLFKQEKDGKLRTVAIHAKKARGALTDFIIRNRISKSSALTEFSYAGYHYSESLSSPDALHFIKKQ